MEKGYIDAVTVTVKDEPGLLCQEAGVYLRVRRQLIGIQGGFNRKGLISDQGGKKKAFFVMKDGTMVNKQSRSFDRLIV